MGDRTPQSRTLAPSPRLARWTSSGAVALSNFGNPAGGSHLLLCVYDGSGRRLGALAPGGAICGYKPCWKELGSFGFRYRSREGTPDGLTQMVLKAGGAGRARIQVKGAGPELELPGSSLRMPVRVQVLQPEGNFCWEATHRDATVNADGEFKAKSE